LELAKRYGRKPTVIGEIAAAQAIPPRFLEIILNEMRQGGFVQSRRGIRGGYMLAMPPVKITVGQIIRFVDGSFDPVQCITHEGKSSCPKRARCALVEMWTKAGKAIEQVYDNVTFESLVERDKQLQRSDSDFCI
jgi:Rrf2 family protein